VMAQQVVAGGQWGREHLSASRESPSRARSAIEPWPLWPYCHEAKPQCPCPGPRFKTSMGRGSDPCPDQDSVDIKEECCINEIRAVGTPTAPASEAHLNGFCKRNAPKLGLGRHAESGSVLIQVAQLGVSQQSEKQSGGAIDREPSLLHERATQFNIQPDCTELLSKVKELGDALPNLTWCVVAVTP